jgi:hypothetical protein
MENKTRRIQVTNGDYLALIALTALASLVFPRRLPLEVYLTGYVVLGVCAVIVGARWVLEAFPRRKVETRKRKTA